MHGVEAVFHLPEQLTAPGNIFGIMSDAHETAIFRLKGITHILVRKSRQML